MATGSDAFWSEPPSRPLRLVAYPRRSTSPVLCGTWEERSSAAHSVEWEFPLNLMARFSAWASGLVKDEGFALAAGRRAA